MDFNTNCVIRLEFCFISTFFALALWANIVSVITKLSGIFLIKILALKNLPHEMLSKNSRQNSKITMEFSKYPHWSISANKSLVFWLNIGRNDIWFETLKAGFNSFRCGIHSVPKFNYYIFCCVFFFFNFYDN